MCIPGTYIQKAFGKYLQNKKMKKTRLSFSSISIENKNEENSLAKNIMPVRDEATRDLSRQNTPGGRRQGGDKKRMMKSSTYQYSKFGKGQNRRSKSFGDQTQNKNLNAMKIPPVEKGVIRIIPLGGTEEIGKNMTAIEIGEDIVVIDAGMHFSNEETPGVDY